MTWQIKKLGKVCDVFADGDWIEKKDQSLEGMRLIQTGNIGNGVFKDREEKARYISKKTFKQLRCTEILPTDCLISRLPDPVGRSCIIPDTGEKMITAVDCTIIRFQKETILPQWFVYYSLSQEYQNQVNRQVSGATRQRISRNHLGLIEIPLPKVSEQQRIVAILDKTFASIAVAKENAEKNLQNARELFESYLQSVFTNPGDGWDRKKLEDVAIIEYGFTDKAKDAGEFRYIRITDIDDYGNLESTNKMYITFSKEAEKFLLEDNDLLMARTGATFAKVLLYKNIEKSIFASYLIRISFAGKVINKFYWHFAKSKFYWDQAVKLSSGSAQPQFNGGALKQLIFSYPKALSEQKSIVDKLDALSTETKKLKTIYQQKLANLEELKKSVLQKAFSGEL